MSNGTEVGPLERCALSQWLCRRADTCAEGRISAPERAVAIFMSARVTPGTPMTSHPSDASRVKREARVRICTGTPNALTLHATTTLTHGPRAVSRT